MKYIGPGQPVLVVEDWQPNENAGRCRRGGRNERL